MPAPGASKGCEKNSSRCGGAQALCGEPGTDVKLWSKARTRHEPRPTQQQKPNPRRDSAPQTASSAYGVTVMVTFMFEWTVQGTSYVPAVREVTSHVAPTLMVWPPGPYSCADAAA